MLSKLKFGIKLASLFAGTTAVLLVLLMTLIISSKIPQDYLKQYLISAIQEKGYGITFQTLSGDLFSELNLGDIKVYPSADEKEQVIVEIKELKIEYNLIKALLSGGAFYEAAEHVLISNANYYISRDSEGLWRSFKQVQADTSQTNETLPLRLQYNGTISFNNLSIFYDDYKGWKKDGFSKHFSDHIENIYGNVVFNKASVGDIDLGGRFYSSKEEVLIEGFVDPNAKQFLIDFTAPGMDLELWANYVMPNSDYLVSEGTATISGFITNKSYTSTNKPPFWLNLSIDISDATLNTPFYEQDIKDLNGNLSLSSGTITSKVLNGMKAYISPKKHNLILNYLRQNSVINWRHLLQSDSLTTFSRKADFLTHKEFSDLKSMIKNPPFILSFNDIEGSVASINASIDGTLNTSEKWMELSVQSQSFDAGLLRNLHPEISFLKPQDRSVAALTIFGPMKSPTVKGRVEGATLYLARIPLKNVQTDFELKSNRLSLQSKNKNVTDTLLSSDITITTDAYGSSIVGSSYLSHIPATLFVDQQRIDSSGNINLSLDYEGNLPNVSGKAIVIAEGSTFFKQEFNQVDTAFSIQNSRLELTDTKTLINGTQKAVHSFLTEEANRYVIQLEGREIPFKDPFIDSPSANSLLSVQGVLYVPLDLEKNANFKQGIFDLDIRIDEPELFDYNYDSLSMQALGSLQDYELKKFQLNSEQHTLFGDIRVMNDFPKWLNANFENMQLEAIPFIQPLFPEDYPVDADITGWVKLDSSSKVDYKGEFSILANSVFSTKYRADSLFVAGSFDEDVLTLSSAKLSMNKSEIDFEGELKRPFDYRFRINDNSFFHLADVKEILDWDNAVSGKVEIDGQLSGNNQGPSFTGEFKSKELFLDSVRLSDFKSKGRFSSKDMDIQRLSSMIHEGIIDLNAKLISPDNGDSDYQLNSEMKKVALKDLQNIVYSIQSMFPKKDSDFDAKTITDGDFSVSMPAFSENRVPVFAKGVNDTVLSDLNQLIESYSDTNTFRQNRLVIRDGHMSGRLNLKSNKSGFPIVEGDINVEQLQSNIMNTEEMSLRLKPNHLDTDYSVALLGLKMQNKHIDSLSIEGHVSADKFFRIEKNEMQIDGLNLRQLINGEFALPYRSSRFEHPINIRLDLSKENSKLLTLFHESLTNMYSDGDINAFITGSLEKPIFSTQHSDINEISVSYNGGKSLRINKPQFSVSQNEFMFDNVLFKQYTDASDKPLNDLKLSGSLSLQELNFRDPSFIILTSELSSKKQRLSIDHERFNGEIEFEDAGFSGDLLIPITSKEPVSDLYAKHALSYPTLSGQFKVLEDSVITVPEFSSKQHDYPLNIDMSVSLESEVYLSGQIVGDLFGIETDLELESSESPLKVEGHLKQLAIDNEIKINEGDLTILSRKFELLSVQEQQVYSKHDTSKISDNKISFETKVSGESDYVAPNLSLSALTVIDNNVSVTDNETSPYTHIVMHINDDLSNLQEITFDIYESRLERVNSSSDLTYQKQYKITTSIGDKEQESRQELTELFAVLFPTFFNEGIDSELLLTDIGKTQFNAFIKQSIFRPVEKQIADTLGFDDVQIDWNIGQKIIEGEDDLVGIQFIRNLVSDKLVLRLNTSVDVAREEADSDPFELSEIELTYFLLKNKSLSLNYSNYKDESTKLDYNTKFSVRVQHDY